jgi:hypothetical protein
MKGEVGRRVFVGSVVAGLPLLAGAGATVAWAQRGTAPRTRDPILDQLLAEMKGTVRAFSKSQSGEHARRLSSSLRLLAAWGASSQIDTDVKQALRGAIAREGRDAILWHRPDAAAFRAEARDLGFDDSSVVPVPALPAPDAATRQRVLDDMLAHGVTAHWRKAADALDAAAAALDRRASLQRGAATLAGQTDPATCTQIAQTLALLNAEMIFWCGPWFVVWFVEGCGLATAAWLGVYVANWWMGCPWW